MGEGPAAAELSRPGEPRRPSGRARPGDSRQRAQCGRPGPRTRRDAQLLVSYRFNVRTPCQVRLQLSPDRDGVEVRVDLLEQSRDGRAYQAPGLPISRSENYSTDQLNLLSAGSGDTI